MKRIVLLLVILGFAIGGGYYWFTSSPRDDQTDWQGWVEADSLFIGPEVTGRLIALALKRGDHVEAGASLFTVEDDVAQAQVSAGLSEAEAPRQRAQEIDVLLAQEKAAKTALEESKLEFERAKTLTAKGTAATSGLDAARAAFDRNTAELKQVRHQISVARLPARNPAVEQARENLAEAEAKLAELRTQARKHVVDAPASGTIQEVYYRPGEVVSAGTPVVALLPPKVIKVRFFVPEAELPSLHVGDKVAVSCDGCKVTTATIDCLAQEAEYTPPVIYSLEERAKLVFRIEAVPDHPEALRVGQPVTVSREAGS
ncbi:HlyD family efflux transporter periplasmic adaptor subunit [Breoghania sp.]|uniref:HlyD family secretion protein n=1 Tax=Breoghania sp. TaxID=2065378 RepID=UPI00261A1F9C|nr:HlyD family efflux transporter periplasmic adaptor subunit [Breoghania sp.]MDJ0932733.1 HlyD family efflux transporter periplasmic adaptor subunit [Breoghania sp.]